MRIRLVSVGRDKEFTAQGAQEYAERIRRVVPLDLVELPAAAGPDAKDREAERILAKRLPRGELWALDEQGTELTSAELASRIARLRDSALDLTLSLGGDEGLGSAVTRGARFTWSLSRLTLPHRLARVVALEQIYRAFEILRGGPYHSQSVEAYYAHVPGLRVIAASFPGDAKGLLTAAIRHPDPVLFLEHKRTYRAIRGDVPGGDYELSLDRANVVRAGSHVTGYLGKSFAGGSAAAALSFDAFSGFTGGVFVG